MFGKRKGTARIDMLTDKMTVKLLRCFLIMTAVAFSWAYSAYADRTIDLGESPYNVVSGTDITNAFNSAAANGGSGAEKLVIRIPKGTYTVGGGEYPQLKIRGNTTVEMEGVTLKRAKQAKNSSMLRLGSKDLDWDSYDNGRGRPGYSKDFSGIHFIGGTWDGSRYGRSIMQIGHASDLTFDKVTFKNVRNCHHLEFGACSNVRIRKCRFTGYHGDFGSNYNAEAIQFEILSGVANGHFNGYNPIDDETICKDVEVCGCTFEGVKRGVGSHTAIANSYFSNFRIHDNVFRNITGYAISMMNYVNSSAYNNRITNCGCGILVASTDRSHHNFYRSKKGSNSRSTPKNLNNKVDKNTLIITRGANGAKYNNANYGIWVYGEKLGKQTGTMPKGDWRASGVTVSDNTITMKTPGPGILMKGTKSCKGSGNKVKEKKG